MDSEVLALFGLDEEPEYSEDTAYMSGIWINGMKVLKRWKVFCYMVDEFPEKPGVRHRRHVIRMDIVDNLTGEVFFARSEVESVWETVDGKTAHIHTMDDIPVSEGFYTATPIFIRAFNRDYEASFKGKMYTREFDNSSSLSKPRRSRKTEFEPYLLNPSIWVGTK